MVKSLYADFYTDVRIVPAKGKFLTLLPEQIQAIKTTKGINNISLVAEEKAVLVNGDYQSIIYLKGVDSSYTKVSGLAKHTVKGQFILGEADEPQLVLGAGIENAVGASPGTNILP